MRRQGGFSLVELAVVLVIVGLMVGGLLAPLSMQLEQRRAAETRRDLELASEALIGFALRNGYLPCPAVSARNGLEDRTGPGCADGKRAGLLPWATLGVAKLDGWGRIFRYSVTPAFSNGASHFTLATARDISVTTRDAAGQLAMASAPDDIPAVIVSHGKNGYGALSGEGVPVALGPDVQADEDGNAKGNGTSFVASAPGGGFDDLVVWISPHILNHRMVAAQRLP